MTHKMVKWMKKTSEIHSSDEKILLLLKFLLKSILYAFSVDKYTKLK